MSLPILIQHQYDKCPLGYLAFQDGGDVVVHFADHARVGREAFFEIFGNCGFQILESMEYSGQRFIKAARILEFSLGLWNSPADELARCREALIACQPLVEASVPKLSTSGNMLTLRDKVRAVIGPPPGVMAADGQKVYTK